MVLQGETQRLGHVRGRKQCKKPRTVGVWRALRIAGILKAGRLARRTLIPKMLIIRNMALTTEAEELYPCMTAADNPTGVVCCRALIAAHCPSNTIAAAKQTRNRERNKFKRNLPLGSIGTVVIEVMIIR
jgi:hypothetical protein